MDFFSTIREGLTRTRNSLSVSWNSMMADFTGENEEFFDDLEESLILADAGAETATDTVERLREAVEKKGLRGGSQVKSELAAILTERLSVGDGALKLGTKPSVILVVGVNGVGKTTTIGKLACKFTDAGKKVLLCAGDTFRAAAAEQLTIWADRARCDIVRHEGAAIPPPWCLTAPPPPRPAAPIY